MNKKRTIKIILLEAILVIALVAVDQLVKNLAEIHIAPGSIVPLVDGIIDLTFVQNTGAAFSMFSNSFYFLLGVRIFAGAAMIFILVRYHERLHALLRVSMGLILAGALGNLIDQILLGQVRDMFAFRFVDFAVFNVADICITIGAVLLFADLIFFKGQSFFREKEKETK
ncbi:MAG: signal peptidase II [Christensenellales bacterium]